MFFCRMLIAAAVVTAVTGCDTPTSPIHPKTSAATIDSRPYAPTIDDDFAALADRAPGFAGIFYDEQGNLTTFVTSRGDTAAIRTQVANFVRSRGHAANDLKIRVADYDFRQLTNWHKALAAVWEIGPVVATDIDERINRLVIAVDDPRAAADVRAVVARLGIPTAAVMVTTESRSQRLSRGW